MQRKLSIIVARSQNNAIGLAGSIPWICPEDMRYFKEKTSGHICLAGFNTYRTLPEDGLPNRLLYVLTQKPRTRFFALVAYRFTRLAFLLCQKYT